MLKIVLVGYDKMLYSLIEGIEESKNKILGVLRCDRTRYSPFQLFFKDIFNPSYDFSIIKSKKLYDIKADGVNTEAFYREIEKLKPDLIIVGSWAEKFKKPILSLVPCVNFHPALLPRNRGANPYFWSIFLNQKVTGLTIHYMNEKFDCGDIILQEAITIDENETGESLKAKTVKLAREMVKDFLDLYEKKQIQPIKQNEELASFEPQLTEKEMIIDLAKSKADVYRHLRALHPWASPWVRIYRRYVKIGRYEFMELKEEFKEKNNHEIIENSKKYFILKGSDFLIKIYK